jgi:hypothetical protein
MDVWVYAHLQDFLKRREASLEVSPIEIKLLALKHGLTAGQIRGLLLKCVMLRTPADLIENSNLRDCLRKRHLAAGRTRTLTGRGTTFRRIDAATPRYDGPCIAIVRGRVSIFDLRAARGAVDWHRSAVGLTNDGQRRSKR